MLQYQPNKQGMVKFGIKEILRNMEAKEKGNMK